MVVAGRGGGDAAPVVVFVHVGVEQGVAVDRHAPRH